VTHPALDANRIAQSIQSIGMKLKSSANDCVTHPAVAFGCRQRLNACRGRTDTDFFCGPWGPCVDETSVPAAARRQLVAYAWFDINSGDRRHPVGRLSPNPWGLHDMIGNVWEWCEDVWHGNFQGAPNDGGAWVADGDSQPRRSLRGGAWDMNAFRLRSSYRSCDYRQLGTNRFGLRIAIGDEH
jgi:formylglycine-generating enzyme required for sulfatase activity